MDVEITPELRKTFFRIKHAERQWQIIKLIIKIVANPSIGKPMRHSRKGLREVYAKPFRLTYISEETKIIFVSLYHKDEQ